MFSYSELRRYCQASRRSAVPFFARSDLFFSLFGRARNSWQLLNFPRTGATWGHLNGNE